LNQPHSFLTLSIYQYSVEINYTELLLQRYQTALDNALKLATTFNVAPIRGNTAILVSIGADMSAVPSRRVAKSVTTLADIAALMALMFTHSCEASQLIAFDGLTAYTNIPLQQGTILQNMASLRQISSKPDLAG